MVPRRSFRVITKESKALALHQTKQALEEQEKDDKKVRKQSEGSSKKNKKRKKKREWNVEAIVGERVHKGQLQYRVKWEGWSSSSNTWEPEHHLKHCKKLLKKYMKSQKTNAAGGEKKEKEKEKKNKEKHKERKAKRHKEKENNKSKQKTKDKHNSSEEASNDSDAEMEEEDHIHESDEDDANQEEKQSEENSSDDNDVDETETKEGNEITKGLSSTKANVKTESLGTNLKQHTDEEEEHIHVIQPSNDGTLSCTTNNTGQIQSNYSSFHGSEFPTPYNNTNNNGGLDYGHSGSDYKSYTFLDEEEQHGEQSAVTSKHKNDEEDPEVLKDRIERAYIMEDIPEPDDSEDDDYHGDDNHYHGDDIHYHYNTFKQRTEFSNSGDGDEEDATSLDEKLSYGGQQHSRRQKSSRKKHASLRLKHNKTRSPTLRGKSPLPPTTTSTTTSTSWPKPSRKRKTPDTASQSDDIVVAEIASADYNADSGPLFEFEVESTVDPVPDAGPPPKKLKLDS